MWRQTISDSISQAILSQIQRYPIRHPVTKLSALESSFACLSLNCSYQAFNLQKVFEERSVSLVVLNLGSRDHYYGVLEQGALSST